MSPKKILKIMEKYLQICTLSNHLMITKVEPSPLKSSTSHLELLAVQTQSLKTICPVPSQCPGAYLQLSFSVSWDNFSVAKALESKNSKIVVLKFNIFVVIAQIYLNE